MRAGRGQDRPRDPMGSRVAVFLLVAAAMAGCADDTQSLPSGSVPDSVAPEIVQWLRFSVHPFDTAEPGGGVADLEFLRDMIGTARVVALGEATHVTHEFVAMKTRIFEFLVEEMGFNTFALEAAWPVREQRVVGSTSTTASSRPSP